MLTPDVGARSRAATSPSQSSMVGTVVFGWGPGGSPSAAPKPGDTPLTARGSIRGSMGAIDATDAAGARIGSMEDRGRTKRRCYVGLATSVDELIHGRDIDGYGWDPHSRFMSKFDDHAGMRSGEKVFRQTRQHQRKPGCVLSKMAVVDTVVFGRDLDNSGEDPRRTVPRSFEDHAGFRPAEKSRLLKPGLPLKSTAGEVLYGKEPDGACCSRSESAHAELSTGAAGVKEEDRAPRGRKNLMQVSTLVDQVVFNKATSPLDAEDLIETYRDYAGTRSGLNLMRAASCPHTARTSREPPEGQQEHRVEEATMLSEQELAKHERKTQPQEQQQHREAWTESMADQPHEPPPDFSALSPQPAFPQRVNPFGVRRGSSASSCSSTSHTRNARGAVAEERRICFNECASTSSHGSHRPRWRS
uniref:Uncharacterized protein n=1 Tax=Alexandrium monilatum TaxID=311494 RepID=A0A7S4R0T4_9DINO|mmetsp:Transcript_34047/g.101588  ORF Transcript_34047/g.101588 Transcript_34047/m.101588 type:complete len:417 (-) Transcript_34047:87-1337(-)